MLPLENRFRPFEELDIEKFETRYELAPTKETIEKVSDVSTLREMQFNAEDVEISIKTQLEFDVDNDIGLRRRRIAALIFWRIAIQNCKRRYVQLQKEIQKEKDLAKLEEQLNPERT
jgi:hypothetical protein